jgi:hypothetical protein
MSQQSYENLWWRKSLDDLPVCPRHSLHPIYMHHSEWKMHSVTCPANGCQFMVLAAKPAVAGAAWCVVAEGGAE